MKLLRQSSFIAPKTETDQIDFSEVGKTRKNRLVGNLSRLALILFPVVFGIALALHLLTLPVRRVPTALTVPLVQSAPATAPGLLIPLGEVGQNIAQGEFGLLVERVEMGNTGAASSTKLLTAHVHLTNFQGSYYKVRNLVGSTFVLKHALGSPSNSIPSLAVSSPLARQPALDLTSKTNMQFGDVAGGWLTFQLPDQNENANAVINGLAGTSPELQFIPANNSVPIRVRLVIPAN